MKKLAHILVFLLSFYGFSQDWKPTYAEALAVATDQDKPLIVVFSGSDWCSPCIKLNKKVLQSEEFISYSNDNYVLYRADFPKKKANKLPYELIADNVKLAEKYNPRGHFPMVVVLNNEENVVGRVSYKKQKPTEYISLINTFIK